MKETLYSPNKAKAEITPPFGFTLPQHIIISTSQLYLQTAHSSGHLATCARFAVNNPPACQYIACMKHLDLGISLTLLGICGYTSQHPRSGHRGKSQPSPGLCSIVPWLRLTNALSTNSSTSPDTSRCALPALNTLCCCKRQRVAKRSKYVMCIPWPQQQMGTEPSGLSLTVTLAVALSLQL